MRWIRTQKTTKRNRLTTSPLELRGNGWTGLSSSAAIAILFGCCAWTAHGQQSQRQKGTQPTSSPPSTTSQTTTAPPNIPAAAQSRPTELRFLVLLDPAHGGTDTGAMLEPASPEKNYTMALAEQLRMALNARGIRSILTRTSDARVGNDARATTANHSDASACISLHAASTGNGVHLFTSSLPAVTESDPRRAFLPWQTAQAAYETSSLRLESDVDAAMTQQHIPVLIARTSILPLDSMACPAIDIEVAPLDANTPLRDPGYQQKVVNALDAALVAWRSDWRQQP
ncbi:MAG TPA: N-acetylmuramoyl-L-alanine amidase [Acidobacteriaceae bacterium]|nr:N-acetylmuramoyl-L-alanine amidase [Acidobacteriaceae bacterium]